MKLVITSDWHHDAYTDGLPRASDVEKAIWESVEHAHKVGADAYMMLGDLSDPDNVRSHRASNFALSVASVLGEYGIPNYWLTGNHDVIEDGGGGSTMGCLKHLGGYTVLLDQPMVFYIGEVPCLALPFPSRSSNYAPEDFVKGVPQDIRVVVGHLNVDGITLGSETSHMPRGRDVFWPLDTLRENLPDSVYVGGHYHEAQTWQGDLHIVGSPLRFTHGEEGSTPSIMTLEF